MIPHPPQFQTQHPAPLPHQLIMPRHQQTPRRQDNLILAVQNILDEKKEVRKLDSKNMLASIELFGNQAKDAWNAGKKMKISPSYKKIRGVVISGMGGSTLGAHLLKSVFGKSIKYGFEIINDYSLPHYTGPETLVIASSYSGNTEETLSAAQDALAKKW